MLGFTSLKDFLGYFLGVKSFIINGWIAFFLAFSTFITGYIWDSPAAVYTLLSVMLFDWTLGTGLALRASWKLKRSEGFGGALERFFPKTDLPVEEVEQYSKRSFSSARFPRIFVAIPLSLGVLAISWNLAKHNPLFYIIPPVIYGGISGAYFTSLLENAAEFGLFSKELISIVKNKINPINWVKK